MTKRIPKSTNNERPTNYAERVGRWYDSFVTVQHKKTHGQYLTPVEIADFMANMLPSKSGSVRILDPGAGTGILSCADCEHLVSRKIKPSKILIEAYETEPQLCRILEKTLMYLKDFASKHGVTLTFSVRQEDFILKYAHLLCDFPVLFPSPKKEIAFDIVISNPPYFKIPKSDPCARAVASIIHGQPNVYSLFMAISSSLLSNGGYFVFITPRSFASGPYFRSFREHFFTDMKPVFIHLFDSRSEAFKRYRVLQENIILKAQKSKRVGRQITKRCCFNIFKQWWERPIHIQSQKTTKGKKVSWTDRFENTYDLNYVPKRNGTRDIVGVSVAFIETAWRRYTKHFRNKAQEIQGAILPLVQTHQNAAPFIGVVLAGIFTEGALNQLSSLRFSILYFPYKTVMDVFSEVGIDAHFDENTPDDEFSLKVQA